MVQWGLRWGRGFRWGFWRGRGQGREVGEGGQGGEEGSHLPRSLPQVSWAEVGEVGSPVEEVVDGVVGRATFRAQWGGESTDSVEVVPQNRG